MRLPRPTLPACLLAYAVVLVVVMLLLPGCVSPAGTYSVEQVTKGLQDAVDSGLVSDAQAQAVGGKIAAAHPGFDWGAVLKTVGGVGLSLAGAYVGLKPALGRLDNKHILGDEEAAALAALVLQRKSPPQPQA